MLFRFLLNYIAFWRMRQKGGNIRPRLSECKVWITNESSVEVGVTDWVIYLRELKAVLRARKSDVISILPNYLIACLRAPSSLTCKLMTPSLLQTFHCLHIRYARSGFCGRRIEHELSNYIFWNCDAVYLDTHASQLCPVEKRSNPC
jgi:hypothetical protein